MSVPMGYDAKDKLFNLKVLLGVNDIIAEGLSSKISSRRNELQKCQALNRLVVAKGRGGGMDWECGISRRKLVYIEWINNKVLLYSTGNYIQYPVIKNNGK